MESELSARLAETEPLASALEERTRESTLARDELEKKKLLKTLSDDYDRERKAKNAHTEAVAHAQEAAQKKRTRPRDSTGGTGCADGRSR